MLKNFENWLLEQNYKSSTAFDYQGRIERLCRKKEATLAYLVENIAEVAANVGKFLKSPIISQKRDILKLILSDCKTDGKNLCFSIAKPFDELLKTPEINKWCRRKESDFRPHPYQGCALPLSYGGTT